MNSSKLRHSKGKEVLSRKAVFFFGMEKDTSAPLENFKQQPLILSISFGKVEV